MGFLLPMIDGGIYEVVSDTDSYSGCSTCDYGSSYVNEFEVHMLSGKIEIEVRNMYDYALSESFLMKLFLINAAAIGEMTEAEFTSWLRKQVEEEVGYTFDEDDDLTFRFREA